MKKMLLFLMGMLMSISIYSQAGAFCEGALAFPNSNSCFNNQVMTDDAQWYSFVAGETTENVELTNLDSLPGHIHRMEFYTGTCAGNNLVLTDSVEVTPTNDTLLAMTETGLTIGTTYYIKLIRGADGCGKCTLTGANYNLCLLTPVELLQICSSTGCCLNAPCTVATVCLGSSVTLTSFLSSGATFASTWTLSPGVPSTTISTPGPTVTITPSATGTYDVSVCSITYMGSLACTETFQIVVINNPLPPPSFTINPNPACVNEQVCVTNTTPSPYDNSIYSAWDFGDGNTVPPGCFIPSCYCNTYTTSGTYNITLTVADPTLTCPSQTVTNTVTILDPSITISSPTVCFGTASAFNLNLVCLLPTDIFSYNWNFGDGTTSTLANPTHTYPSAGTYTVTLSLNGGAFTATTTATVNPLPPVPIITGTNIVCVAGTTLTYTISNYNSFYTYPTPVVFPIGAATSVSSVSGTGTFTVTWSGTNGGQIAITVVDSKGCQNTGYFDVLSCCIPPVTIPVTQNFVDDNATNMIATYATGSTIFLQTFYINGTFTVDQNLTWEQCTVYLGPYAKINIINNSIFRIADNSILQAGCGIMWDRIYIPNNSHVLQVKTSIVQDGINAIVSDNGGIYDVTASVLNKNYKSIVVNSYSPHHFGSIGGTTVSCVASATSPGTLLLPPYNTERSAVGIEVNNVRNALALNIGAPALAGKNTFDNLDIGVYSNQSNVKIVHNDFKNIQIIPGQVATAAIYAVGKPFVFPLFITYNLTVGGYGVFEPNTFLNCVTGVYTTTNMNVNVYKNDFNFITQYGVRCETSRIGNGINIKNNDIKNFTVGIRCRFNTFCNTQIEENKLKITSSFFFPSSIGIWLEEPSTASTVSDYKVFNNKIQVVKYGIRAFLLNGAILDNNKIELRPSGTTIGIEVIANYGTQITTNDVQSIPATYTTSVGGIYASMSPLSYIYCNTVKDMGYGIKCAGSMASDIFKNTMKNDFYGFWLDNNGFVGLQDRPGFPGEGSYNKWILPIPGARCYATNSTDGTSSPFVYRSGASSQLIPLPSITDFSPLVSAIIATGTTTGPPALALCPSVPPPTLLKRAQDLAMEMIAFPGNDANTKWLSKQGLFHNIKSDSIDVSGDAILQTFVNQAAIENVGKLSEINKTLVDVSKYNTTDMLIAQSLSSSIVPNNDIETNQKLIADIIVNNFLAGVDYSSSQLSDLRILASKCPFTDGIGVYQARVLLSPIDSIGTEYANSCETGENRSSIFNSESVEEENTVLMVYPNPASDQLTINYQLTETEVAVFEIYNVIGEIVLTQTLNTSEGEQKLSLTNLNSGIYFYKYSINDRIVRKNKLVIVK